jgi:hypothetical protein
MVCGEILISGDAANMAMVSTDKGEKFDVGRWDTGTLVQCDAGNDDSSRWSVNAGELDQDFDPSELPADFCLALVEL